MYKWYGKASRCYAYLEGITPTHVKRYGLTSKSQQMRNGKSSARFPFKEHRWFTRGWTLQELIAPEIVKFYGQDWAYLGSSSQLLEELVSITGVSKHVLSAVSKTDALRRTTIAQKMSWAAKRKTTRIEDQAYCLLGIFEVHIPLLYGEGTAAFIRLQEEIIRSSSDQSIFAWSIRPDREWDSYHDRLLAPDASHFEDCVFMIPWDTAGASESFQMTNTGLTITLPIMEGHNERSYTAILSCGYANDKAGAVAIHLISDDNGSTFYVSTRFRSRSEDRLCVIDVRTAEEGFASFKKSVLLQLRARQWAFKLLDEYEDPGSSPNKLSTIWMSDTFGVSADVSSAWKLNLKIHQLLPTHSWRQSRLTGAHIIEMGSEDLCGAVVLEYRSRLYAMTFGFEKRNWHREAPSLWINLHELGARNVLDDLVAHDEAQVSKTSVIQEIPNGNRRAAEHEPVLTEIYGFATRKIGSKRAHKPQEFPDDCLLVEVIPMFAMGELRFEIQGKVDKLTIPNKSLLKWAPQSSRSDLSNRALKWRAEWEEARSDTPEPWPREMDWQEGPNHRKWHVPSTSWQGTTENPYWDGRTEDQWHSDARPHVWEDPGLWQQPTEAENLDTNANHRFHSDTAPGVWQGAL
jgi:hypothetical protein